MSRTGMSFIVAEVRPGRFFTLQTPKPGAWDPQDGTIRIRDAVQFPSFVRESHIFRQIEGICASRGKRSPVILRLVAMEAIITRSIYQKETACKSPEPSSSDTEEVQTESSSIPTSRVELTLSSELKTYLSMSLEGLEKAILQRISQKSRSLKSLKRK